MQKQHKLQCRPMFTRNIKVIAFVSSVVLCAAVSYSAGHSDGVYAAENTVRIENFETGEVITLPIEMNDAINAAYQIGVMHKHDDIGLKRLTQKMVEKKI